MEGWVSGISTPSTSPFWGNKLGWHFLTNHTSLVTHVFKAKYFPNCDFLGASVGHNPSFVWRSVWSSQKLLKHGVRWTDPISVCGKIFGFGMRVAYCIARTNMQDLEGLRVKDLLHPQTNEWNPAVINMIFVPVQMSRVLNVPLYRDTQRDHRVWRYDRRGARSVMATVTLWTTVSTHNI